MGQYINVGIIYEMKIYKKELEGINVKTNDLLETIEEECYLNINNYNVIEEDTAYTFRAKDEIFNTRNIKIFLEEQFKLMGIEEKDEILEMLQNIESNEQIINCAKEKKYLNFREENFRESIKVEPFHRLTIYSSSIVFFMEGKVYLECYDKLFKYIKNTIKSNSDNETGEIVRLFLQ